MPNLSGKCEVTGSAFWQNVEKSFKSFSRKMKSFKSFLKFFFQNHRFELFSKPIFDSGKFVEAYDFVHRNVFLASNEPFPQAFSKVDTSFRFDEALSIPNCQKTKPSAFGLCMTQLVGIPTQLHRLDGHTQKNLMNLIEKQSFGA